VRRFVAFGLILLFSLPAAAVGDWRVKYIGGTAAGMSVGVVGSLDTTSETSLIFQYAGNKIVIPYASIESFDHTEEVTRHLGVLPAIVVDLVKARQRRHFFRISYRAPNAGPNDLVQVAVFEVPKRLPRPLQAVLNARAPHTDKSCKPCGGQN